MRAALEAVIALCLAEAMVRVLTPGQKSAMAAHLRGERHRDESAKALLYQGRVRLRAAVGLG